MLKMSVIEVVADDRIFKMLRRTIEKFPLSSFCRVMKGETIERFYYENNRITIDGDPNILSLIVDFMRGYEVDVIPAFEGKYKKDLVDFGLEIQQNEIVERVERVERVGIDFDVSLSSECADTDDENNLITDSEYMGGGGGGRYEIL